MEGGKQAVAIGKIDQYLLAGVGARRIMPQIMPHRLQVAADPGKGLAAKGRYNGPDIISQEPHLPYLQ